MKIQKSLQISFRDNDSGGMGAEKQKVGYSWMYRYPLFYYCYKR